MDVRARVSALIARTFGSVEEDLVAAGILDSVRSMELLLLLEKEFGVRLAEIKMAELSRVTSIVETVEAAVRRSAQNP